MQARSSGGSGGGEAEAAAVSQAEAAVCARLSAKRLSLGGQSVEVRAVPGETWRGRLPCRPRVTCFYLHALRMVLHDGFAHAQALALR